MKARAEIVERAREAYNRCLNDMTFVNRQEAAKNAAVDSITADVWNNHGIKWPVDTIGRDDLGAEVCSIIKEMGIA